MVCVVGNEYDTSKPSNIQRTHKVSRGLHMIRMLELLSRTSAHHSNDCQESGGFWTVRGALSLPASRGQSGGDGAVFELAELMDPAVFCGSRSDPGL